MPHFVIHCSEKIVQLKSKEELFECVFQQAEASQLFAINDIKVRLIPFEEYRVGESKQNFIHVFAYIMQGRTSEQKKMLSDSIVKALKEQFPSIPVISMNVMDFEKATYCNKSMIE